MNRRTTLLDVGEVMAWWAVLTLLWLVLISAVDILEVVVGASVALVGAFAAWGAHRAVGGW